MTARRILITVTAVLLVLTMSAAVAAAAWMTSGSGVAVAQAGSVPQGNTPVAALGGSGGVDVSWAATVLSGGQPVTYDVQRHYGTAASDVTSCQDITAVACFDDITEHGTYTYTVTAQVNSWRGAASAASNAVTIVVAGLPETPSITVAPSDPSFGSSATFEFASTGATSYSCKLDTGSFGPCASPKVYSSVASGAHTFAVKAHNAAGDSGQATHSWTSVTLAPDAPTITSSPDNPTTSTAASFTFESSRATGFTCKLDSAPAFTTCLSPQVYTGLSDGQHTFSVKAANPLGESAPTSFSWTVDTQPPGLPDITVKPAAFTNSTTTIFEFSGGSTALPKTYKCKLDAAAYGSCTSPKQYTGLTDGSHTFSVLASNANGDGAATSHTWTVDTVDPVITFTGRTTPNAAGWNNTDVTVSWSCADALSGAALASVSQTLSGEGSGQSATGTCTDLAGNTADDTRTGIKIDKTAPVTTSNAPSAWTNAATVTVDFTRTDSLSGPVTTYYTTATGGTPAEPTTASSSGNSAAITAAGVTTIKYRSIDAAGNLEAVRTATVQIDRTNPATPAFSSNPTPANNATISGLNTWSIATPTDTGGAGVAGVQFEYRSKTNATDAYPSTWTPAGSLTTASPWEASINTALLDKPMLEFRARTVDNAGNSATVSRTYSVRPQVRDITLANKPGGTLGRLELGDQMVITYSQPMNTTLNCLNGVTGTVAATNNDRLSMTLCKFGTVLLNENYLSGAINFTNSSANWSSGGTVLTITLGTPSDATKTNVDIAASSPTVQPTADLQSASTPGVALDTGNVTSPTTSRF